MAVLNSVNNQMGFWNEANAWRPQLRLAMVWAHAHQIFTILTALSVPIHWVTQTFLSATRRLPNELFERNPSYWLDVAHPGQITWLNFVLMGSAYGIGRNSKDIINTSLNNLVTLVAFREDNGVILPALPLFRDISRSPDILGSFLGGSYAERLTVFFGKDRTSTFDSGAFTRYATQAINELENNPDALGALGDTCNYNFGLAHLMNLYLIAFLILLSRPTL